MLACLIANSASFAAQTPTELIIINGIVRTMDDRKPLAEAIAIANGRITAIGSTPQIRSLASSSTMVIDARGRLVLPGFNDAHVHFTGVGNWFSHLDASAFKSREELLARIAHFTSFLPKGRWVLGARLNRADLQQTKLPSLAEIDDASPEHPVFIYLSDPTKALVNSAALSSARIEVVAPNSRDTEIERDPSGRATGVVHGSALTRIRNGVPRGSATNWAEIAEAASNYAASLGVTSVQDVHSDNLFATYHEMSKAGKLKTRIYECVVLGDWEKNNSIGMPSATGDAMVRGGCVKWFADGTIEERGELGERVAKADKAGLQVMIHAIGADENKNTIDAFEFAASKNGRRDRRFRIEHTHNIAARDIVRLSRLSLIASMQPALFYRGDDVGDDLAYIFKMGASVAFGSDASMIDIDPLMGIHAAVNSGKKSISVGTAVRAYTLGSAYAEFQENEKGSLAVGKLADVVILSHDIFAGEARRIRDARVVMTIVGGRVVYEKAK